MRTKARVQWSRWLDDFRFSCAIFDSLFFQEVYNAVVLAQTAYCSNERMPCPSIDGKRHCLNANSLAVLKVDCTLSISTNSFR